MFYGLSVIYYLHGHMDVSIKYSVPHYTQLLGPRNPKAWAFHGFPWVGQVRKQHENYQLLFAWPCNGFQKYRGTNGSGWKGGVYFNPISKKYPPTLPLCLSQNHSFQVHGNAIWWCLEAPKSTFFGGFATQPPFVPYKKWIQPAHFVPSTMSHSGRTLNISMIDLSYCNDFNRSS